MSARNNAANPNGNQNERELRVQDRERNRNRQLLYQNIIRQRQERGLDIQNIQQGVGVIEVAMANRDDHRPLNRAAADLSTARNNSTLNSSGGTSSSSNKRKCMTYGTESVESWAATEIEQETFAFLWSLKGYSAFTGSDEVKSPVFRGGPKSSHYWQLKMSPKKKAEEQEYFAVHLILTGFGDSDSSATRKLKVRFQISILDVDGRPGKQAGSANMNVCEFKKCSVWGYDKFILSTDLTATARRLIDEDTLKIHCRVWIEGEVRHRIGNGGAASADLAEEDRNNRQKVKLSEELGELRMSTDFADVALVTAGKTFMAHKCILAARSKVFAAMFSAEMMEAHQNSVEIHDFDEDSVQGMLEFMYTAQVENLSEKAGDLMQIAEKYDLKGLKEECEHSIAENLTVENAAEVLLISHLYNAVVLKPKVIDFINRNKDDVKKTKAFLRVAAANAAVFVELYLSQ